MSKSSVVEPLSREVVYKEVEVKVYAGRDALTDDYATDLLGWQEESENIKYGSDFQLVDGNGHKVRCVNNVKNRPLYRTVYESLKQEILRCRWRMNGEPIIIGETRLILNGQHTLVALKLAVQEWHKHPGKWYHYWPEPPTIDKLIIFGIEETDDVVNTMDTCKPRSLTDVIYRSRYFGDMPSKDRRMVSRILNYAVRMLWHRTGAGFDAFAPRRTHAESLAFLDNHPKLLECVGYIHKKDGGQKDISRYLSLGYASALLYLMATAASDPAEYTRMDVPNETVLNWQTWDKACEFWALLAANTSELQVMREAREAVVSRHDGYISLNEQIAILVKAWLCVADGQNPTLERLELAYEVNEDGIPFLAESPSCGGIDLGDPATKDDQEAVQSTSVGKTYPERGSRKGKNWAKGDAAWVMDGDGNHYYGELECQPYQTDDGRDLVVVQADDGQWEVEITQLHLQRPG